MDLVHENHTHIYLEIIFTICIIIASFHKCVSMEINAENCVCKTLIPQSDS
jgi:hypothetical protein